MQKQKTQFLRCCAEHNVKELGASGTPCYGIQWPEAYEERAYKEHNGFGSHNFPFESTEYTNSQSVQYDRVCCANAKALRAQTVCLFLHPSWDEVHINRCIDSFKKILSSHLK